MRCFVAIDVAEHVKNNIAKIQKQIYENHMKLVEKNNLHITLKFLGEKTQSEIKEINNKLSSINIKKFKITFRGVSCFPSENYIRVVWIGVKSKKLLKLCKEVHKLLGEEKQFIPHITIARVKRRPTYLKEKIQNLKYVEIGDQTVKHFVLKKSTLTPHGPVYDNLKLFTLT